MNYVRLLARIGDVADAVTASDNEIALRERRPANQFEDAKLLLAKAQGISEANERVLTVIRDIFKEIERGG